MRNAILTTLLTLPAFTVLGQQNVTIEGKIKGLAAGQTVYAQPLGGKGKDSTISRKGSFTLRTRVEPGAGDAYILQIGKQYTAQNMLLVYVDEGKIRVTGNGPDFKDAKTTGIAALKDYNNYNEELEKAPQLKGRKELYEKSDELYRKDSVAYRALEPELEKMRAAETEFTMNWIRQHPASPISAFLINFTMSRELEPAELEAMYNSLEESARNNAPAKKLANTIRANKATAIGKPAPLFTQNDTLGKPVNLADFKGKYVLVDFWASWCVPCRAENPHVVAAFKKYQSKNFTVLGVSFDREGDHDKWIKAIHDDHLTWTHVSDLKYWDNAAGRLYDIKGIPANVLVDPQGIIVGKNLRGEELFKKLEELLGPASAGGPFSIKGSVKGVQNGVMYLNYAVGEKYQRDSATITNGTFSFKGETEGPVFGYMLLKGTDMVRSFGIQIVLEGSNMEVIYDPADTEQSMVKGGSIQQEMSAYTSRGNALKAKYQQLLDAYDKANNLLMEASRAKKPAAELEKLKAAATAKRDALEPYFEASKQSTLNFFYQYPASYVTAYMLRFSSSDMSADTLKAFYDRLGADVQQSSYGKEVLEEYSKLKAGSPGSMAAVFEGTDINGKPLSLLDYRGKYVLVDFWASWCVPCRAGNPHLLKLYAQYKPKGFEIIGVSDDDSNPDAWKKAVAKDKIGVWKHVLRGLKQTPEGYDKSEDRSEAYGIHTLPTKILIDPEGKIVGRYGGGGEDDDALDKKLAEVMK